jgi:predicted RNase H-like HicB family nuclease
MGMPSESFTKETPGIITRFINAAMKQTRVEILDDDGRFYGEIPSCQGVWATGKTKDECLGNLREVLEEWTILKLRDNDKDFPVLDKVDLNIERREAKSWGE